VLVSLCSGCGLFGPSKTAVDTDSPPLVVFFADNDPDKNPGLDQVATALNDALKGRFGTGSATRVSPVNIADARAVVEECNVPGAEPARCWSALAQLNHASQVLVPDLSTDQSQVSVVLTRYDATGQKVLRTSQKTWKSASEAQQGVVALVADVASGG
jgi:hypothetical protein